MPFSTVELAKEQPAASDRAQPARGRFVYILAIILAMATFWPIRAAFGWMSGSLPTARTLHDLDGIGETIFPIFAMFALPGLAAAASLTGVFLSILVFTSPVDRTFRLFTTAGITQGTVALAIYLTGSPVNSALGWMLKWFEDPRNSIVAAAVVARQEAAAAALLPLLIGTAVSYLAAAALAEYAAARSEASAQVAAVEAGDFTGLPPDLDVHLLNEPPQAPSVAARAFAQTTYEVRPRAGPAVAFLRRRNEYDIRAAVAARSNQEHFSYSMDDGLLRREPEGVVLLSVQLSESDAEGTTYEVIDATGARIATIALRSPGGEVRDARGRPLLTIIRTDSAAGVSLYVAVAAGHDVGRYTWSSGTTVLNPLLLVDFDSRAVLDRALAIVVAPFLEEEARLESERYFRYSG